VAIKTVLCPVDFTSISQAEILSAVEVCSRFGARLVIEHNLDPRPPPSLGVGWMWSSSVDARERKHEAEARKRLQGIFKTVPKVVPVEAKLTRGPIAQTLLQLAHELPADLIVAASHGKSTAEHESLTEQIVTQSACAVMTTHAEPLRLAEGAEIVVAIDFSPASEAALECAFAIAERAPVRLVLFHVETPFEDGFLPPRDPESRRSAGGAMAAAIPADLAGRSEIAFGHNDPARAILDCAKSRNAGAIVLGLHPRGIFHKHLSDRAREVLHQSRCPIWFVPVGAC